MPVWVRLAVGQPLGVEPHPGEGVGAAAAVPELLMLSEAGAVGSADGEGVAVVDALPEKEAVALAVRVEALPGEPISAAAGDGARRERCQRGQRRCGRGGEGEDGNGDQWRAVNG